MNLTEMKIVHDFETDLAVGKKVQVRWTCSRQHFVGFGKVEKLNKNSVRVTLTEKVESYPIGQSIRVPLLTTGTSLKAWSRSNRVEPKGGY